MFKVIGDKEELREPIEKFVTEVNEEYLKEKDNIREILKARLDKVKMGGAINKINLPDVLVGLEEDEEGFIIRTIVGKNKFLNTIFFMAFRKGKKNLTKYLKEVGIKDFKILRV